jgi:hypothetical protein
VLLHSSKLDQDLIRDTFNVFLKFEEDIEIVSGLLYDIAEKAIKKV